jgi:hypothetical protein
MLPIDDKRSKLKPLDETKGEWVTIPKHEMENHTPQEEIDQALDPEF